MIKRVHTQSENDDEENEYVDNECEDNDGVSEDDEDDPSMQDQQKTQIQVESRHQQATAIWRPVYLNG